MRLRFGALLLALLVGISTRCAEARVIVEYPPTVSVGSPFIIRITAESPITSAEAVWQGRTIPLDLRNWNGMQVAAGLFGTQVGKVAPHEHGMRVRIVSPRGKKERMLAIRVLPKKYVEDRLSLPEHMVTPPSSVLNRIKGERVLTASALSTVTGKRMWDLPIERPVPGIVTSPYGRRRILNGQPRTHHGGMDFRAATGTPVRAAFAGKVILTGDHYYAGKSIYVDSGGRVISHYFHLDAIDVQRGDILSAGQVIGRSGMSGRATGPHLHFGVAIGGQMVNPEPLFSATVQSMLDKRAVVTIPVTAP